MKLGYNADGLGREYERWQRERATEARQAFNEMLGENAFVEFWGRLGKIGGEGVDGGVAADDLGEDEGEGGGGKVDMKTLAKNVDLKEMERVLKGDKRYLMFDHAPDQRERWLRVSLFPLCPHLVAAADKSPIRIIWNSSRHPSFRCTHNTLCL